MIDSPPPATAPEPVAPPPAVRRVARWPLLVLVLGVAAIGVASVPRLQVSLRTPAIVEVEGRRFELVEMGPVQQASSGGTGTATAYKVRYWARVGDGARRRADATLLANYYWPVVDSLGLERIIIAASYGIPARWSPIQFSRTTEFTRTPAVAP